MHCPAVPEIGFTVENDSVSESETSYMVNIQSSVAGPAASGLVEIYTLTPQDQGTATGKRPDIN